MNLASMLQQWQACQSNSACNRWENDFQHALEIAKQVELDSWEGLDADGVAKLLRSRILSTITVPVSSDPPALQSQNVERIVQCFKLPSTNTAALQLKESLRCLPLMWDSVQIPSPQVGAALVPRLQTEEVEQEFKYTHPLCGRLALAGLVRPFTRTRYPPVPSLRLARFYMGDNSCLIATTAQCWNFAQCWKSFLQNHVGKISDVCMKVHWSSEDVARRLQ